MKKLLRIVTILFALLPSLVMAEGSKQLTPNQVSNASSNLTLVSNDRAGYLSHDANFATSSGVGPTSLSFLKSPGFNYNGATYSEDHRLYVRVKPGETLHYGVHRTTHDQGSGNQADLLITVKYRVVATGAVGTYGTFRLTRNTNSTRQMLLNSQAGVIDNASQAFAGPKAKTGASTTGYNSLTVPNTSSATLDVFFEFNQENESGMTDGQRFSVYDYWDFTVLDASNNEKTGRMFSKLWSFSAGGTTNVFSKNFNIFPLIPSETQTGKYFVKKVELAGIAPQNFFRIVTNKFGSSTSVGSTFEERRKSQTLNSDYAEYYNFVNDPDPEFWPSAAAPTFSVNINPYCSNTLTNRGAVTFTGNSSEQSTFMVLIDLNNNGVYDPGTADVLLEQTGPSGAKTIEWNGLNGLGQPVASGTTINYRFKNGSAPINFPVWDAETNLDGFRVGDVRPLASGASFSYNSELYWDDSNLSTARFPAPQTQLFGTASSTAVDATSGGVHKWGAASATAGDLYTVNTWTYGYTNSLNQTLVYTYDCSADLAVTNTAAAGPYYTNQNITYTVTATNNGPQTATNSTVAYTIPAGMTLVSATPSVGTYNATTGVWSVPSLTSGVSATMAVILKPTATGTFVTTASRTGGDQADNNSTNNTSSASVTVSASADVAVTNTISAPAVNGIYYNGDQVTYTVTATNNGPNSASGVVVTDLLPAGITFVSSSAGTAYDATTGKWTIGTLANGSTVTMTLTGTLNRSGSTTTTATQTHTEYDAVSSNNTAISTITVAPSADVQVTNVVSNSTPNLGEEITYTVTVKNNGLSNATNVVVTDNLPAGLTIVNVASTTGTFTNGSWTVGNLLSGQSQVLTITAKPNVVASITTTATQTHTEYDKVSANNSASNTITVNQAADIAVTNTVSAGTHAGGTYMKDDVVTYTIKATNNGPNGATGVSIKDLLPASLLGNIVATPSVGTYNATTGIWTVGTLANGATATLTLSAKILQENVNITTTATKEVAGTFDPVSTNNSASNTVVVGSTPLNADVKVSVAAMTGTYYNGDNVTFRVTTENIGPDGASNLTVYAPLPAGFTYVSSGSASYNPATGIWTLGSLASGASSTLDIIAKPSIAGTFSFTASKQSATENDSNTSNNTDTKSITITPKADIAVTLSASHLDGSTTAPYYNNITTALFKVLVTNNGPDVAYNVTGSDSRTGAITITKVPTTTQGSYNPLTGVWTIGTLQPGQSVELWVEGIPNTTGRINISASKTNMTGAVDPITGNDASFAPILVEAAADLAITNTVVGSNFYNGGAVTFEVNLSNLSKDAASGAQVNYTIPAGFTFVSASTTKGTYNAATGVWTLGSSVLGETSEKLTLVLMPTQTGNLTTYASATAGQYDSNAANNTNIPATVTVQPSADIKITNAFAAGPYYIQQPTTYKVTAENLGPNGATNVQVLAPVPADFTVGTVTPSVGTYDASTGIWTIPTLASGVSSTLTFEVTPAFLGTKSLTATKQSVAGNVYDPVSQNNQSTASITTADRAAIYTTKTNINFYDYRNGFVQAAVADPDGAIVYATILSGSLPAGMVMQSNGNIVVDDFRYVRSGTYTLSIKTLDSKGGETTQTVTFFINKDRDGDGVDDFTDIDNNNDGITNIIACRGADPYGDDNNDGLLNYVDPTYVHPKLGAFRDNNNDGINDLFDTDLDGIIDSLDIDIDGDGITNAIEANGGIVPTAYGYSVSKGILVGAVSVNGMPVLVQTSNNSGVSLYAMPDSDKDGLLDFYDLDSDNDGLTDMMEGQPTLTYRTAYGTDADRDGLDDAFDASCGCGTEGVAINPVNTDNNGLPDYLDIDSDDDLISDFTESFDDNGNGKAIDDLIARAARFEAKYGKGYYLNEAWDNGNIPNWLKDDNKNGIPNFLEPGNKYYFDTNGDGLVELFDARTGGESVNYLINTRNTMNYRDAAVISPMPVTLVKFTAQLKANTVVLSWSTATEVNNDRFFVERSTNGVIYEAIGSVKGAGNSSTQLNYSLIDAKAPKGTIYYRLKQVDIDGKYEYSAAVAVTVAGATEAGKPAAILYPNPTSGVSYLSMAQLPLDDYTISIYSADGRLIRTQTLNSGAEQRLDVSTLATGKYILRILGNQHQQSINFIKN